MNIKILFRNTCFSFSLIGGLPLASIAASPHNLDTILYGAAYYEEYSPTDRLDEDIRMMKKAGISVVRIAESTWATEEPHDGVFDFSHVDRVLDAMDTAGIKVIIGTPTYAIPPWLAKAHPDVLVDTPRGKALFGKRQNMDISNPDFRNAAQKIIVALVDHVRNHKSVIGYQIDNETGYYDTSGPNVQAAFLQWTRARYPDLNQFNKEFLLDYWSNRLGQWDDFPSTNGTVNASIATLFVRFQQSLVNDFLGWESHIVRTHARPDQFLTHNYDLDWRGYSYGLQKNLNPFITSHNFDITGVDIYHHSQSQIDGATLAFGDDLARSYRKNGNFLVLETQAQGFPEWTPYPDQLRLQAYSHVANGAAMVEYWHWSTTTNSYETYWRGVLGQDNAPNPVYDEVSQIGNELKNLGPELVGMHKHADTAIYVSNNAQTAFNQFDFHSNSDEEKTGDGLKEYNDVLRPFYNALFRMNIPVDFIDPTSRNLSSYKLIIVPALYAASDDELNRLKFFARSGGHVIFSFKSGFSDENVKVRSSAQPGNLTDAVGAHYEQYTRPVNVSLAGNPYNIPAADNTVRWWMEFLIPDQDTTVLARYAHPVWSRYAAATRHAYGKGEVTYIGFMPSDAQIHAFLAEALHRTSLWGAAQKNQYPLIMRNGMLKDGHMVHYLLNYSDQKQNFSYDYPAGKNLLTQHDITANSSVSLPAWGVAIIRENSASTH